MSSAWFALHSDYGARLLLFALDSGQRALNLRIVPGFHAVALLYAERLVEDFGPESGFKVITVLNPFVQTRLNLMLRKPGLKIVHHARRQLPFFIDLLVGLVIAQ